MKKLFLLIVAIIAIGIGATAQNVTVSGTVVYEGDDEPLVGASVTPLGERAGVITDIDGKFKISVPASVKNLMVSYVGMITQEVKVPAGGGNITVRLTDKENVLDEVLVVAYGTVKKAEYTGSASVVKADQLEDALVANVTNALSGKMAGVQTFNSNGQPGTSATVMIRGVGSINASKDPLYVVDGMPFDGDIATIATSDIESLTVLKDAASTALYGARGANGVILVTTKRGKIGKAKVTADMRWGSSGRAVPNYDVITDQRQYLETAYQAIYNTGINFTGLTPQAAHDRANSNIWQALGYQTWTIPEGQEAFGRNGKFNPNATPGYSNGRYYFLADDWEKESLRHGLRQEYSLNITGGNDRINYYVSGSYLEDEGIVYNSHFNRLSTRAAVDYQAYDWLKIGTNMSYTYTDSAYPRDQTEGESATSSGNTFYFVNMLGPMYPMYVRNPDGSIMWNETYNNPIFDYGDGADYGNGNMLSSRTPQGNPRGSLTYDKENYLADVFEGKWYANINPIEGLDITGTVSYLVDNTRTHQVLNGLYGQFAALGGEAIQVAERRRSLQTQILASYSRTFAEKHNADILVGYESQDYQDEYVYAQGENLYNPDSFVVSNTINNLYGAGAQLNVVHLGWIGRLKYNYDGKYYFMASMRHDGSSRFAPEHRWGTFWSLSGGWDIQKEKFLRDYTWIDLLKFKISFGQNGNDGIGKNGIAYADQYRMEGANSVFSDGTLYYKGNRDITWEKSNNFNTGFDFAFWNGKLTGTVEYFQRQTSDMLFNIPVSPSLGYSTMPMNVGSMRNSGFEIDLNYRIFDTKNVIWDVFANLTLPKNKILKLDPSLLDNDGYWWLSTSQFRKEGESMYQLALVRYAGVDPETGTALYWAKRDILGGKDGKEVIGQEEYKTTKYIDARDTNRWHTGDIMPKGYGGFGTSVKAYGFDLSLAFSYQFGGKLIDYGYLYDMHPGTSLGAAWHKDVMNAWTPENKTSNIPALYTSATDNYANALSDRFLTSSNYLSLNNITFGYTLPGSITRKIGVNTIRIYGAAENVALWSKRQGLDPRQGFTYSDNRTYAPMRSITGGIHVEF